MSQIDQLQSKLAEYESLEIYVIEMRVRPDWYERDPGLFLQREPEWYIVDHRGDETNVAFIASWEIVSEDMPKLDLGYETRVRHLLTNMIVASNPGVDIPDDYISPLDLRCAQSVEDLSIEKLKWYKAEWFRLARDTGLISMCYEIGRSLGSYIGDKKYEWTNDLLRIYVDDYGNYMTVSDDGKTVCSTHSTEKVFVPGDWALTIDAIYPQAYKAAKENKDSNLAKQRQLLIKQLGG